MSDSNYDLEPHVSGCYKALYGEDSLYQTFKEYKWDCAI